MLRYLKDGFRTTASQYFLLIVLWMYQFAWGLLLLIFVKNIVVPLMHRYPSGHMPSSAVQLFLAEGEFQLMKTGVSHPYLWTLCAIIFVRMALTPMINAGIFYSIHNTHLNAGYRFFKGVKELSGTFSLYYLLQVLLTAAPIYWIYPIAQKALQTQSSYETLAVALLPWILGLFAYGYLIHLIILYLMLGKTTQAPALDTIGILIRRFPIILVIAGMLLLLSGALTALTLSASLLWAGLSALILHQMFHVLKMLFKLWAVSTQYHYFTENNVR
jgi:hypothetical protein